MITLDERARKRLRMLLEASGDSILAVHYKTCDVKGNRGVSRTTLYRLFAAGNGHVRAQERVFHRVVEIYRGALSVLDVKQWVLHGDPRGCPLPGDPAEERKSKREWPSDSA